MLLMGMQPSPMIPRSSNKLVVGIFKSQIGNAKCCRFSPHRLISNSSVGSHQRWYTSTATPTVGLLMTSASIGLRQRDDGRACIGVHRMQGLNGKSHTCRCCIRNDGFNTIFNLFANPRVTAKDRHRIPKQQAVPPTRALLQWPSCSRRSVPSAFVNRGPRKIRHGIVIQP